MTGRRKRVETLSFSSFPLPLVLHSVTPLAACDTNRDDWEQACLVPVRRLPRPFRSMHFGEITRNASAAHNNEA